MEYPVAKKSPKPKERPKIDEVEQAKKREERSARRAEKESEPYRSPEAPPLPEDFPEKGDEIEDHTFAAVGRAMSDWTMVEIELTRLFVTLVQGKGAYISVTARAFGAVKTVEGRLDMLRAAAEPFFLIEIDKCRMIKSSLDRFFENQQIRFEEICKSVKDCASIRNKIGHGVVGQLYQKPRREIGYALQPAPMDSKSTVFQTPTYAFTSEKLNEYSKSFRELRLAASTLNVKIRHLRDRLAEEESGLSAQPHEK
jgi:hypothetical protein